MPVSSQQHEHENHRASERKQGARNEQLLLLLPCLRRPPSQIRSDRLELQPEKRREEAVSNREIDAAWGLRMPSAGAAAPRPSPRITSCVGAPWWSLHSLGCWSRRHRSAAVRTRTTS